MKVNRSRVFEEYEFGSLGYADLETLSENNGRVYVTPDGQKYPSITTILGHRGKEHIDAWRARVGEEEADRVSHHATTRGTAVHDLIERYLKNEDLSSEVVMPHVAQGFYAAQKALDKSLGRIAMQEVPLFSHKLQLAGRVDLIAEFDGKLSIIDFKTSKIVKTAEDIENYFIQCAFYGCAFYERTGIEIKDTIIIMVVDGRSEPLVFKNSVFDWIPTLLEVKKGYEMTLRA